MKELKTRVDAIEATLSTLAVDAGKHDVFSALRHIHDWATKHGMPPLPIVTSPKA